MRPRTPPRPSQRAIHNQLQGLAALHTGATPEFKAAPAARQSRPRAVREAGANDALKQWRQHRPDVTLYRNNVGSYPLPTGGYLRYGLCNGSADFVGLRSVTITPGMVGKRVAIFLAIESKAPGKDAEAHQQVWLDEVRDAGAIVGVARNAEEAEDILRRWDLGYIGDER